MTDQPEPMSAADAKLHVAEKDRKSALKAIEAERTALDRSAANHKKRKDRFERTIARAVTSDPSKVDWYTRPGPLPADQVRTAASINSSQLHRIMERQRPKKKKGRR